MIDLLVSCSMITLCFCEKLRRIFLSLQIFEYSNQMFEHGRHLKWSKFRLMKCGFIYLILNGLSKIQVKKYVFIKKKILKIEKEKGNFIPLLFIRVCLHECENNFPYKNILKFIVFKRLLLKLYINTYILK